MKSKVLITGIKGFLGKNLISILKSDFILYGLGRKSEIYENIEVFSSNEIDNIILEPDFIVICHASVSYGTVNKSEIDLFESNISLTKKIIKKFIKSKIIYISTVSIFDLNKKKINESSSIHPNSEYAISKYWAELIVNSNPNSVILRLSSLYGIGMKENTIIPNYVNQAIINNKIEVWGKGNRLQNYIHVSDVCNLIKQIIFKFNVVKGEILLAVSNKEYSNKYLAQLISEYTNSKIIFVKEDKTKSNFYNNSKTNNKLEFKTQADFKQEIHKYIQWKKNQL